LQEANASAVLHKHIGQQQRRQLKASAASAAAYAPFITAEKVASTEDYHDELSLEEFNNTFIRELLNRQSRKLVKQAAGSRKLAEHVDQHEMLHLIQVSATNVEIHAAAAVQQCSKAHPLSACQWSRTRQLQLSRASCATGSNECFVAMIHQ
jgi:hypothetical protein